MAYQNLFHLSPSTRSRQADKGVVCARLITDGERYIEGVQSWYVLHTVEALQAGGEGGSAGLCGRWECHRLVVVFVDVGVRNWK